MDVIYCTLTYYGNIHPLRSNFHAITKRVTSYILWNDHGLAFVITNVAAVHSVYFEVLYCCLLVDVLSVVVDTTNIVLGVEGVTMDVTTTS